MQDKSFQQAVQDLQDRLSTDFQNALDHILADGTTVTRATGEIQDEKTRAIVKDTLIAGQMMAFLKLMKEMYLLDRAQYDEFAAYLMRSLNY
jgi:hypothetical protein